MPALEMQISLRIVEFAVVESLMLIRMETELLIVRMPALEMPTSLLIVVFVVAESLMSILMETEWLIA